MPPCCGQVVEARDRYGSEGGKIWCSRCTKLEPFALSLEAMGGDAIYYLCRLCLHELSSCGAEVARWVVRDLLLDRRTDADQLLLHAVLAELEVAA